MIYLELHGLKDTTYRSYLTADADFWLHPDQAVLSENSQALPLDWVRTFIKFREQDARDFHASLWEPEFDNDIQTVFDGVLA